MAESEQKNLGQRIRDAVANEQTLLRILQLHGARLITDKEARIALGISTEQEPFRVAEDKTFSTPSIERED